MQNNYDRSFALVLRSEGGFTTDINDSGNKMPDGRAGSTNMGVTQRAWEEYVGHPVTWKDMRALTPDMISPFYKRKYWDACDCDQLPTPLDYMVFDFGVNAGVGRAVKLLQECLAVPVTGQVDKTTILVAKEIPIEELIASYSDTKRHYYKMLQNPHYERGWLARVDTVEANAKNMLG